MGLADKDLKITIINMLRNLKRQHEQNEEVKNIEEEPNGTYKYGKYKI